MRNIILLLVVILSGCSPLNFQYNTLNTAGQLDSIYGDVEIIETESDIRKKVSQRFQIQIRFTKILEYTTIWDCISILLEFR